MACLVCRSTRLRPLYDGVRDHYGIAVDTYRFLECEECGSATLDPLPAPETLASLYPADYTFKRTDQPGSSLRRLLGAAEWQAFYRHAYRHRLRALQRLTGLRSGAILEVGCGSGLFLRYLEHHGYDVEGVEISKTDVDYARDEFSLRVFHGTLETLDLPNGRYDGVILHHVLEHIPTPAEVLGRIAAMLKGGGWVIVGLPLIDSGQARLLGARWYAVTEAPRHVMIPSLLGVKRLLVEAGFRDVLTAPTSLVENAGHIALSLMPSASTPLAYGQSGPMALLVRRFAGALLLLPALLIASAERLRAGEGARAGSMIVCGRT